MSRKSKIIEIDPSEIITNPKNPNKMDANEYNALVRNIKADGKLSSLPLCRREGDDVYMVDGHHRVQAYIECGFTAPIKILVMDLSKREADLRGLGMNNIHGRPDEKLMGDIFKDLAEEMPEEEIASLTAFSEEYITDLIEDLEEDDIHMPLSEEFDSSDLKDLGIETEEYDEKWVTLKFRVPTSAAAVINEGIALATRDMHPDAKNPTGQALEFICSDFIAGAPLGERSSAKNVQEAI